MTFQKHTQCTLCRGSHLQPLPEYSEFYLSQCISCSFIFTERIPSEEEIMTFYRGYGRADYLSPITILRYNQILDKMEKFRKTNRILDVGCGIGYFLEEAKKRGWDVYGTEFTDEAVLICNSKGIKTFKGAIDQQTFEAESFDILTSIEVLEHLNTPKKELETYSRLLRKGGLFYITTPNFNSLLRKKIKAEHEDICYPEHLSYFTPKTLKQLVTSAGLKTYKIETTGFSISKYKNAKTKRELRTTNISATSTDEQVRKLLEKWYSRLLKKCLNKLLTLFGVGDSLKGWFIKK